MHTRQNSLLPFINLKTLYGQLKAYKIENTAVEIRRADHATPSIRKNWH
jgi:hypothetical protein